MSTEKIAFLAAICAQPDDDTARLVYADWLEEFGGEPERAEFIRVQCELARLPGCFGRTAPQEIYIGDGRVEYVAGLDCGRCETCVRRSVLGNRERELLQEDRLLDGNWNRWLGFGPFVLWSFPDAALNMRCEFRRGFVHDVECIAADWLKHADNLRAAHPVRAVTLTTPPPREGQHGATSDPRTSDRWRIPGRERWHFRILSDDGFTLRRPTDGELLVAEWPGVTFTLPPPELDVTAFGNATATAGTAFTEFAAALTQSVLQGLAIPPHLLIPPPG
jgi:uncharacterized protein (TIGR02996 family)